MQLAAKSAVRAGALRPSAVRRTVRVQAGRDLWLPGSDAPAHLDGSLPGDFGFDPLGLGANADTLKWFAEAERVHCRWAMLGVAGILGQEVVHPEQFWYMQNEIVTPQKALGLLAIEFWAMHFVELKRWQDFRNPGSVDVDPLFPANKLPAHEVGYPGGVFAPFVPGNMDELKLKEIKNGRLAMLAFIGFVMAGQTTGKNPLAALQEHLADPWGTTMFSKAAVVPGMAVAPPCAIPESVDFGGIAIKAGCFLQPLWP